MRLSTLQQSHLYLRLSTLQQSHLYLGLRISTLSGSAVLGVKAPSSQSFTRLSTEQKLGGRGGEAWLIPLVQGNPKWQENYQLVIAIHFK